jgi:hypothetical protein
MAVAGSQGLGGTEANPLPLIGTSRTTKTSAMRACELTQA